MPDEMIAFWRAAGPAMWFAKSAEFDRTISDRYLTTHQQATSGQLDTWATSSEGSLALVLLLDQFPRNMFRNSARAFATDLQARAVAQRAIATGQDQRLDLSLRPFMYLPFEHAEDLADQDEAVRLMQTLVVQGGDEEAHRWAVEHRDIIRRFGRFPHRNAVLDRSSTADELIYLATGGFSG